MRPISLFIVTVALLASSGCRTFTSPARSKYLADGKVEWIDAEATRRHTFIYSGKDGKGVIVAAEPPPDVALGAVVEVAGKLNFKGIDAQTSAKLTESIAELGQRTEAVMVLREGLFRLQEWGNNPNTDLTTPDRQKLFGEIIAAAKEIALAEKTKAEAQKQEAIASTQPSAEAASLAVLSESKVKELEAQAQKLKQESAKYDAQVIALKQQMETANAERAKALAAADASTAAASQAKAEAKATVDAANAKAASLQKAVETWNTLPDKERSTAKLNEFIKNAAPDGPR
jgi:chromosome segregation ATPase